MSNKAKFLGITFFCLAVAMAGFTGAYMVFLTPHKLEIGQAEQLGSDAPPTVINEARAVTAPQLLEAAAIEERISEDTKFVYEYYYPGEDRSRSFQQGAPFALISLTREELIKKIDGWQVVSFSPTKVVLRKNMEASKDGVYILGVSDGYVAVFYGGSKEAGGLMELTDTPVASLSEGEQLRLNEGIQIIGEENLNRVLEDYGS